VHPPATVFCDFDGTVTGEDSFDAVAVAVAPELWGRLKRQLFAFELTLRQAMAELAAGLGPSDLAAMVAHMDHFRPRPGFVPFLDALDRAGIPFVLVSGGLQPLVERVLAPHRGRLHALVAAQVGAAPTGGLVFHSPWSDDEELVAKARVLDRYGRGRRVVIGDSITDLGMAQVADLVFAREPLCDWLTQRGISHHRWHDFDDVAAVLRAEGLLRPAAAAAPGSPAADAEARPAPAAG
jgi:2-hydroxy-3-keto-5-methylthiopentenyl-1-phosphate phosphatase